MPKIAYLSLKENILEFTPLTRHYMTNARGQINIFADKI